MPARTMLKTTMAALNNHTLRGISVNVLARTSLDTGAPLIRHEPRPKTLLKTRYEFFPFETNQAITFYLDRPYLWLVIIVWSAWVL